MVLQTTLRVDGTDGLTDHTLGRGNIWSYRQNPGVEGTDGPTDHAQGRRSRWSYRSHSG